jgi:hypothetical protein
MCPCIDEQKGGKQVSITALRTRTERRTSGHSILGLRGAADRTSAMRESDDLVRDHTIFISGDAVSLGLAGTEGEPLSYEMLRRLLVGSGAIDEHEAQRWDRAHARPAGN